MKKILIFSQNEELAFSYLLQKQDLKNFKFILICNKPPKNLKFTEYLSRDKNRYAVHLYDYSFNGFYKAMGVLKSTVVLEKIVFIQPEIAKLNSADLESLEISDFETSLCTNLLKPTLAVGHLLPLLTRSQNPEIRIMMPSFRGCNFNYMYSCTKQALQMYFSSLQIEYPLMNLELEECRRSAYQKQLQKI